MRMSRFLILITITVSALIASAQVQVLKGDRVTASGGNVGAHHCTGPFTANVTNPVALPESMIKKVNAVRGNLLTLELNSVKSGGMVLNERSSLRSAELWTQYLGTGVNSSTKMDVEWTTLTGTATDSSGTDIPVLIDIVPNYFNSSIDNIPVYYTLANDTLTIPAQQVATATLGNLGLCYILIYSGTSTDGSIVMTISNDGLLSVDQDELIMYGLWTTEQFDNTYETNLGYYQAITSVTYSDPNATDTDEFNARCDPKGLYLFGFYNDAGYFYDSNEAMIPAYSTINILNTSSESTYTQEWSVSEIEYNDSTGLYEPITTITSDSSDFAYETERVKIYGPVTLTAATQFETDTFTMGWGNQLSGREDCTHLAHAAYSSDYFGNSYGSNSVVGRANADYGWTTYVDYATPDIYPQKSVATQIFYQGKPDAPLYFEEITMLLYEFVDRGIDLTCSIVLATRASNGDLSLGDVVAQSNTVDYATFTYTTLEFSDFFRVETNGDTTSIDHIFMEDEFAVVIDGWDNGTFSAYLMSEEFNDAANLPSYYYYLTGDTETIYYLNSANRIVQGFGSAYYGYLYTDSNTDFTFDAEGGERTIHVEPYMCTVSWSTLSYVTRLWLEDGYEIPDWITVSTENENYVLNYEDYSWEEFSFDLVIEASPITEEGQSGRSCSFRLYQEGAVMDISVTQYGTDGVTLTTYPSTTVFINGNSIELGDGLAGDVYNAGGQLVGRGVSSIDASAFPSGVYIVKLDNGTTAKVVK